jgi:ribonuclease T1
MIRYLLSGFWGWCLMLGACSFNPPAPPAPPPALHTQQQPDKPATAARPAAHSDVPAYALEVLDYVKKNNRAPEGFVGGRTFENRENRLPDQGGIHYREWDVHPKVQGQNRGAERLITGSDRSAWYTGNHYRTFIRIE